MEPKFENVHADIESTFRSIWFSCSSFAEDHTWHYHPEFELTWVLRSQGTRFVGDSIEPYHPGDIVLVGPNLPHCWHDESNGKNGSGPEVAVLQFRPESFGTDFLGLPELVAIRKLFRMSKCGLHIRGGTAARIQTMIRGLVQKKGMSRLVCLFEILETMAQAGTDLHPLASADYHITNDITEANQKRIELVHRYVRKNLQRNISQAEVARLACLTPAAFSRFFRRATGHTFVGFVKLIRINAVCHLLMETSCPITDIALNCGYNNIANFNRQFLALKGMNPTQYRDQRDRLLKHNPLDQNLSPSTSARNHALGCEQESIWPIRPGENTTIHVQGLPRNESRFLAREE